MALVHDSFCDFVLFPRNPSSYLDMLDARGDNGFDGLHYNPPTMSNMQQNFTDSASNTYDPYPSASTYPSGSSAYYTASQLALDPPKGVARQETRRWTPSGPPSPSVSQSYEHPPSAVSSVSGASGQSTASSVVGSPYSHATQSLPGQKHWTDPHLGLGIAVGTCYNDTFVNDIFPSSNIDHDLMFEDDKYPNNFVGKSGNISTSSISTSHSDPSAVSFSPPSQNLISALHAPPLALDTSVAAHHITIDTILEEVNSGIAASPQSNSRASGVSKKASPTTPRGPFPVPSIPHMASSFKAPTTPTSAMSFAPRGFSPPTSRQRPLRRHSTAVCGDMNVQRSSTASSGRFHPYGRPILPPVPLNQSHENQSQPPFFSQSSGKYIAPLESSCWFSLIVFLSPDFFHI